MSEETVKLNYSSPENITFHGEVDTGVTVEEWNDMSEDTRREIVDTCAWELIEMNVTTSGAIEL